MTPQAFAIAALAVYAVIGLTLIAWQVVPLLGAAALVLALLITVATFIGRYHYAADAVFGILIAVVVFAIWR